MNLKLTKNLKMIIAASAGIVLMIVALLLLNCEGCAPDGENGGAPSGGDFIISGGDHDHEHESADYYLEYNENNTLLVDREGDELVSVRLVSEAGDYLLRRGKDGGLTLDPLDGLALNEDFLGLAWYNAASFGYSYRLRSAEGAPEPTLSDYGLDPCRLALTSTYSDGSSATVRVGYNVGGNEDIYYFTMDGKEGIYTGEFSLSFFQTDSYWLSDDVFEDAADGVTIDRISLTGTQFPQQVKLQKTAAADRSDPMSGYDYTMTAPKRCAADDYQMSLLVGELDSLIASEAVCAHPSAAQLKEYGLDSPYAAVEHERSGKRRTLLLSRKDATTLYAATERRDVVYELSADSYPTLAALSRDSLRSTDVHVRYFQAIETIRVQADGIDLTFRVERTPLATDETLFEYRAYYGERQLTLTNYKGLLEVFNGAAAISFEGGSASGEPYMTVTLGYFDGFARSQEAIRYYPAGTRRYLVDAESAGGAVVSSMWLERFIEDAQRLARDETVAP